MAKICDLGDKSVLKIIVSSLQQINKIRSSNKKF